MNGHAERCLNVIIGLICLFFIFQGVKISNNPLTLEVSSIYSDTFHCYCCFCLLTHSEVKILCVKVLITVNVKNIEHFSLSVLTRMLVIRTGTHTMLVRKANREDPDQAASSEAV